MPSDYQAQLFALQPPGRALPQEPDSVWGRLLSALANEFERIELRSETLVHESDPRSAYELLPDWERVCGLPGECFTALSASIGARRAAVVCQLAGAGGQNPAFFASLAQIMGLGLEITEFRPFIAGISRCGASLDGDHENRHIWAARIIGQRLAPFRCGNSGAGERLLDFARREDLECLLNLHAPAQSTLITGYEGEA